MGWDTMKRVLDSILAGVFLIVFSPLFLIVAILVKCTSKGPAFYKQRRIGLNNKEFVIYKFRTMKIDTPTVATNLLNNPQSYITSIGGFLRSSSLDELPQLINIIKGDMSFVGPRPALYNQYDLIDLRTQNGIHMIRPGLTGWAQVNGRDEIDDSEKVRFDRYYLEHMGIVFDLRIIILTAVNVFLRKGIVEGGKKVQSRA